MGADQGSVRSNYGSGANCAIFGRVSRVVMPKTAEGNGGDEFEQACRGKLIDADSLASSTAAASLL
jgi:hypothetical protein